MLGVTGHPPWPRWLVAAIITLPITVPMQFPKFLDGHMLHGMIHEHTLNATVVPIHRKVFHLLAVSSPLAIVIGRRHSAFHRSAPAPHHIHEHRDLMKVMAGWIHGAPVPSLAAALDISSSIVEPVVVAVTGPGGNGL